MEEYGTSNTITQKYLQGYHGLVKTLQDNIYYYQDELGSTSHIAGGTGALIESYQYDLYGKPRVYNSGGTYQPNATPVAKDLGNGGARWIPDLGLYDDRNRFMSPDLGRFIQPDPIGFKGDASNLYRYCGNDWANKTDPMGLFYVSSDPVSTVQLRDQFRDSMEVAQLQKLAQTQSPFQQAVQRYEARNVEAERGYYNEKGMRYMGLDKNIDRMINAVQDPSKKFDNRDLVKGSLAQVINAYLSHNIIMDRTKFLGQNASQIFASDHISKIFVNPAKASHASFDRAAVELIHEGTHMVPGYTAKTNMGEFNAFKNGADMGNHGLGLRVTVPSFQRIQTEYNLPDQ